MMQVHSTALHLLCIAECQKMVAFPGGWALHPFLPGVIYNLPVVLALVIIFNEKGTVKPVPFLFFN